MKIIGGIIAVIMGIVIIAMGQIGYGVIFLLAGVVLIVLNFGDLKTHNESQVLQKEQTNFIENISTVADLENPITVTVKVNDSLKRGKFSVFLNGTKVGNISYGEAELKFNTTKEKNLVKVGQLDGSPFNWPESGYEFDATQGADVVNLEVTHKSLLIILKRL